MKLIITTKITGLLLCCFAINAIAQKKDLIDTALIPFYKGRIMYNESVLMVAKDGEPASAQLLFKPDNILSVKNAALNITYKKGTDWTYENGRLKLLKGSKAVYMTTEQLYPQEGRFARKAGGFVLYNEGSFFHERQLAVTYKHAANAWGGPVPVFQGGDLPETMNKLKRKALLKLLLFGDSIAAGSNASGENSAAPHLPAFGALVAEGLKRYYQNEVTFVNTAVGGMDSNWGRENTQKSVLDHHPDLVIIAFGMNDGTGKMDPQVFKANIKAIIEQTRKDNPKAEFVLVSTTMPNPESQFTGTQEAFTAVLKTLTEPGIVLVDMTAVHKELLKHKAFPDMTGNNINHPNDFLMRWYAQQILGVLIPH
ncbi:MAG: SGNH/GDSL hydrolase family protein [Sphingobacteriaceae bacterium]